jgi:hypothetical protein
MVEEKQMKWLINLVAKWTGASAIWAKVDGYKTKIGATALILSGLAGLLTSISGLSDMASVLAFVKSVPTDASWLILLNGLGILGIGHKIEKTEK